MTLHTRSHLLSCTAGAAAMALTALFQNAVAADAGKGADAFDADCAECHSVAKTLRNKKGPSLFGIVDRPAAAIASFDHYSDALKNSHIVWTPAQLDAYIKDPHTVVPGGKMKFDGVADANERADLLAFLAEQK